MAIYVVHCGPCQQIYHYHRVIFHCMTAAYTFILLRKSYISRQISISGNWASYIAIKLKGRVLLRSLSKILHFDSYSIFFLLEVAVDIDLVYSMHLMLV